MAFIGTNKPSASFRANPVNPGCGRRRKSWKFDEA
jgi:hypothetical protein